MIDVVAQAKQRIEEIDKRFTELVRIIELSQRSVAAGRDEQLMLRGEYTALNRIVKESTPPVESNKGTGEGEKN